MSSLTLHFGMQSIFDFDHMPLRVGEFGEALFKLSHTQRRHIPDEMATTDEVVAEAAEGFFLAAEHGRSDVLKALADHAQGQLDLRQIVDPATGRTPLHVAVANGKTDAVRVLLAAGFPPDHESLPTGSKSNGFSASDASGKRQNTAYLLAKQLRASDLVFVFHQFTIQQIATNNADGVSQMLSAGVDVDTTDGSAQNTFVHWSVTCSAAQVLELLLQREDVQQAKVMDKLNTEGATPLHLACRTSNVECTRLLLRYGADRGVEGEKGVFKGKTAIEMATAQEVRELFTAHSDSKLSHQLQQSEPSGSQSTSSSLSSPPSSASTTAESAGEDDNAGAATTSRRNSRRASEQELQSARLLVQLEEKDLLIVQLRKTIETLVVESQEIRKLGDERVVLDYVRKLREVCSIDSVWPASRVCEANSLLVM